MYSEYINPLVEDLPREDMLIIEQLSHEGRLCLTSLPFCKKDWQKLYHKPTKGYAGAFIIPDLEGDKRDAWIATHIEERGLGEKLLGFMVVFSGDTDLEEVNDI